MRNAIFCLNMVLLRLVTFRGDDARHMPNRSNHRRNRYPVTGVATLILSTACTSISFVYSNIRIYLILHRNNFRGVTASVRRTPQSVPHASYQAGTPVALRIRKLHSVSRD